MYDDVPLVITELDIIALVNWYRGDRRKMILIVNFVFPREVIRIEIIKLNYILK